MKRHSLHCRPAFTLLELIVTLTIAALLASLVMLSVRGHLDRAAMATATDRVVAADAQARRLSGKMSSNRIQLTVDTVRNQISLGSGPASIGLPSKIRIVETMQLEDGNWRSTGGRIRYTTSGCSSTYYIGLSTGELQRWLVFLGLSGQCVVCEREEQLLEFLR
jgi:prepilin-type N-terminal cleavage/methylation domain-containing protein